MGTFIPFEEVDKLATIEELARRFNLPLRRYGSTGQLRCACPVHGGDNDAFAISPNVSSKRGSMGVFFCRPAKSGGDRIGLVAHLMEMGQQDAAFFIQEQFGTGTVDSTVNSTVSAKTVPSPTVPQAQKQEGRANVPAPFDPVAFAAKLVFSEEVAAAGFTEADAERFSVGLYRGQLYLLLRNEDGSPAGWVAIPPQKVKLPPKWLEPRPQQNVVRLVPKSA